MADRVLRDHSQPCEHASQKVLAERPGKWFSPDGGGWQCSVDSCPGGREVTIDYEAFRREYFGTQIPNRTSVGSTEVRIRKAVVAALGGSDG